MSRGLKRALALILCLCALIPAAYAEGTEDLLSEFVLHHGDRNVNKIAITVDDCYQSATEWITYDVELCRKYGVAMTFFPLVRTGCLEEKYRDIWQDVVDSGCEIGTHTSTHRKLGNTDYWTIVGRIGKGQEALDKTLGYHYQIRWLRPPYGNVDSGSAATKKQVISAIRRYGFDHIIHWDVSETINMKNALQSIQNGSILLFHAKKKDSLFLEELIPELQARGFEMVTVSELFGFDPPEISEELYVYNKADYQDKD